MGEDIFLNNKGKDGSHVVDVTTYNLDHLALVDDTYVVRYIGTYDIADYADSVKLSFDSAEYTGSAIQPKVTIDGLQEGVDFTVTYENNINPGQATVVITGIGSYAGTITKNFTITEKTTTGGGDEGDTKPTDPSGEGDDQGSVGTGDNSQVTLYLALLLISGGAFAGTKLYRRKTQK